MQATGSPLVIRCLQDLQEAHQCYWQANWALCATRNWRMLKAQKSGQARNASSSLLIVVATLVFRTKDSSGLSSTVGTNLIMASGHNDSSPRSTVGTTETQTEMLIAIPRICHGWIDLEPNKTYRISSISFHNTGYLVLSECKSRPMCTPNNHDCKPAIIRRLRTSSSNEQETWAGRSSPEDLTFWTTELLKLMNTTLTYCPLKKRQKPRGCSGTYNVSATIKDHKPRILTDPLTQPMIDPDYPLQ